MSPTVAPAGAAGTASNLSSSRSGSDPALEAAIPIPISKRSRRADIVHLFEGALMQTFVGVCNIMSVCIGVARTQVSGISIGESEDLLPSSGTGAGESWREADTALVGVQWALECLFTVRMVLMIIGRGFASFKDRWLYAEIVIISLWFTFRGPSTQIIRLILAIRFVPSVAHRHATLFHIIMSLRACFPILVWSFVVFMIAHSFVAGLLTGLLQQTYFQDPSKPLEEREELYGYFGTFYRAVVTMFEMMFEGGDAARLLGDYVSPWFFLLKMFYQVVMGFAAVNVIMGVFLEQTFNAVASDSHVMLDRMKQTQRVNRENFERFFRTVDSSGDGLLQRDEFTLAMQNSDISTWMEAQGYPAPRDCQAISDLFDFLDTDSSGHLSLSRVIEGMSELQGAAQSSCLVPLAREIREIRQLLTRRG